MRPGCFLAGIGGMMFLWTFPLYAAAPIPPEKRVAAEVMQHFSVTGDNSLHMPTDVAVDSKERILVADGVNHRIVCFDAKGGIDTIISDPNGYELNRPLGLTVDSDDNIWIADTGNHRVVIISADDNATTIVEFPGELNESPSVHAVEPTDITITPDGARSYVIDNENHRILIRDNRSDTWKSLGRYGPAIGNFRWPFMVCIGAEGYVFVTEAIGSRVQRISPGDRWSGQIGSWGVELGQFYRPKGVIADDQGRIYVSDSTLKVVQVFDPWGRVEGVLCTKDGQPLRFEHPMGICFDRLGYLYVVELTADRIAKVALDITTETNTNPKNEGSDR